MRAFQRLPAQIAALVLVSLLAAQIISTWMFFDERALAVRAAIGFEAVGRAANVARLLQETPAEFQDSIITAANSPLVRFRITGEPEVLESSLKDEALVVPRIKALMDTSHDIDIRVKLQEFNKNFEPMPHLSAEMTEMHMAMMQNEVPAIEMALSIRLSDQRWMNVRTRFEQPILQWSMFQVFTYATTAIFILGTLFWFLISKIVKPLQRLATAAEKLGRGEQSLRLQATGPLEIRDLTVAFSKMQQRIKRFVSDRSQLLAALGHDLRSPLTALRVQIEMIDNVEERNHLIRSVEEMSTMIESTLTFARGMVGTEDTITISLGDLFSELENEFAVIRNEPVKIFIDSPELDVRIKPIAIKRAIRNLIENALRYGNTADIQCSKHSNEVIIDINDDGPGIPQEHLERVFDPFYRIEKSRSLETGGHGLGLAIVRTIVRAHGGEVTLANRHEGGLTARVTIPLTPQ